MPGIAVIGTGQWGTNHARVFKELCQEGAVSEVKLCDSDKSSLSRVSASLGLEATTDYRDLLHDPAIQAASIATPSTTHYQIARQLMEAGKDVMVEKPMTMSLQEAAELVRISEQTGRVLMVGHLFRYHPGVRELKRRIDAGELGQIEIMMTNRFAFGLPRRDMGVIWALGIHELDMFCYLMGVDYPRQLLAVASNVYSERIEETVMLTLDFGKTKGYALESWMVPSYGKRRDLVVVGSQQSVRIDYLSPAELWLYDARIIAEGGIPRRIEDKGEKRIAIPYGEPLKEELRHFLDCVVSRQKPLSDGAVGLRAVAMAEAALASAKTGKAVSFSAMSAP